MCTRCGKAPFHPKHQCPGRDAECHKCRKIGHFQSMCRSVRGLSEIGTEQVDYVSFSQPSIMFVALGCQG